MNRHPFSGSRVRAWFGGLVAALTLVALIASPALAVTWGTEVPLTGRVTYRPEIVRTGPSSALAIWQLAGGSETGTVYARRTTNSGASWSAAVALSTGANSPAPGVSSYGALVDFAYVKQVRNTDGSYARRVFYRRSLNGGATWSTARSLTTTTSQIADVDVARSSTGQVSVIWTGLYTGSIYMRTSTDSGASFAGPRFVGKTANSEIGRRYVYRSDPQLAIGDGVTYLVYTSAHDTASVRRTRDRGVTWSAPVRLSTNTGDPYSIVASGAQAVVGYTTYPSSGFRATYRRTYDRGSTWSTPRLPFSPPSGKMTTDPQFAYQAGVLAVIFQYGTMGTPGAVYHKQSSNLGTSWSALTRVSVSHNGPQLGQPRPAGIAVLGPQQLAGYNQSLPDAPNGYWVRRGS